jgi:hypothetical protein
LKASTRSSPRTGSTWSAIVAGVAERARRLDRELKSSPLSPLLDLVLRARLARGHLLPVDLVEHPVR